MPTGTQWLLIPSNLSPRCRSVPVRTLHIRVLRHESALKSSKSTTCSALHTTRRHDVAHNYGLLVGPRISLPDGDPRPAPDRLAGPALEHLAFRSTSLAPCSSAPSPTSASSSGSVATRDGAERYGSRRVDHRTLHRLVQQVRDDAPDRCPVICLGPPARAEPTTPSAFVVLLNDVTVPETAPPSSPAMSTPNVFRGGRGLAAVVDQRSSALSPRIATMSSVSLGSQPRTRCQRGQLSGSDERVRVRAP